MTFKRRIISVEFNLGQKNGTFNAAGNTKLSLKNLRTLATIDSTQGGATAFMSQLEMQIWGMKNADMNAMSTLGLITGIYNIQNGKNAQTQVIVQAGDEDGMTTIFSGAIYSARVEYNAQPDVCLTVLASATLGLLASGIAPSSRAGVVNVADMLKGICSQVGMTLVNNGVVAQLANHCVGGSALNQIADICLASGTNWAISPDGNTLTIWPVGSYADKSSPIVVAPGQGLVGYPEYSTQGIDIQTEFNPNIVWGRRVTVKSSIPTPNKGSAAASIIKQQAGNGNNVAIGATGTYYVYNVVHNLSCYMPGGPWFTSAKLGDTDTRSWR